MLEKITSVLIIIFLFYMTISCISIFQDSLMDSLSELIDEFDTGFIEDIKITYNKNSCENGYTPLINDDEYPMNFNGFICNKKIFNNDNIQIIGNRSLSMKDCVFYNSLIGKSINKWKNALICYKRSSNRFKHAKIVNVTNEECGDHYKMCGYVDTLNQVLCVKKNSSCPVTDLNLISNSLDGNINLLKNEIHNLTDKEFLFYENNGDLPKIYSKFRLGFSIPCFSSSLEFKENNVLDIDQYFSSKLCEVNMENDKNILYQYDSRYIALDNNLITDFFQENDREEYINQFSLLDKEFQNRRVVLYARQFLGWKKECKLYGKGMELFMESEQLLRKLHKSVITLSFLMILLLMLIGLTPFFFYDKFEIFFRLICIVICFLNFFYSIHIIGITNYIINSVMDKDYEYCSDEMVNKTLMMISQSCLSIHYCYVNILIVNILYSLFVIYGLYRWIKPFNEKFQETYKKYIDNE